MWMSYNYSICGARDWHLSVRVLRSSVVLEWNENDLQKKLEHFQKYYNETRVHSSLGLMTPSRKADSTSLSGRKVVPLENYRWNSHSRGLYQLPVAA